MHYLLVGPGALGCLLCCAISRGMNPEDRLTVLDYNPERAEYLSQSGIIYEQGNKRETFQISTQSDPAAVSSVDVVLLCVKSYDILDCLSFCSPLLGEHALIVYVQNGISHLDYQGQQNGSIAAFSTTTEGATLLGPGHVRHAGRGITYLGFPETVDDLSLILLENCCKMLQRGGLQVHLTSRIVSRLWAKLFINVGINALTAILSCNNGQLLHLAEAEQRMKRAIAEAVLIARKKGIEIIGNPLENARSVCNKTAENISSMLQDVRAGKKTEIDAINTPIVEWGKKFSIATPENELLCRQVKEIEATYDQ